MTPKLKANPTLPRNLKNPAGGTRLLVGFKTKLDAALGRFRKDLELELDRLVPQEREISVNAKRYWYLVDPALLLAIANRLFDEQVGPAAETFREAVKAAYSSGTLEGRRALQTLMDDTRDLTSVLRELPFLRRAAFLEARAFEQMKGFLGDTAARLGSTLLTGLVEGKSIRDIKASLVEQFEITKSRAERIARTEVIGALRRGRVDEARDTAEAFGVQIGMMWFSALSPTTRDSHAERHGQVYTPDEVAEFYSEDANAINCKCSQVEVVLVDGKPIQDKLVARETERRDGYLKRKDEADE